MPLVSMPNGEVVEVADGATPEAIAKIKLQFPATAATRKARVAAGQPRKAPLTEEQREIKRRVDAMSKNSGGSQDFNRMVGKGITGSFMDEIGGAVMGATKGTYNAIRKGDIREIGKEYRITKQTEQELDRGASERSPWLSGAGELAGAVLMPLGAGEKGVAGVAKAANALGATRTANVAAKVASKIDKAGPIAKALLAGGNQGALNAAGNATDIGDVPSALGQGYGIGALTGGITGGALHLGSRGTQIIRDALPGNAQQVAYGKIADLLDNAKMTPERAVREIAVTDARGGDAMVQDLSPGLRAKAANLSRKPDLPSSNEMIARGESRIAQRRDKFGNMIRQDANIPAEGDDFFVRQAGLAATRKAKGQADYAEGGAMDDKLEWTPELDKFFREAPPNTDKAIRGAYQDMLNRREMPAELHTGPDGTFTNVPNLRTFDYMKRRFDADIGAALKAGDSPAAQALSAELTTLKGMLGDANPTYKQILASQRDLFQKQDALEIGSKVVKRLSSAPREVLEELKKLQPNQIADARIGIIDALINLDNKPNPVSFFRSVMRNKAQREVLEFAFGSRKQLNRFNRWVSREARAFEADKLTAPGMQSETARIGMADETHGGAGDVLETAGRGFAYGGSAGLLAGAMRAFGRIAHNETRLTQEEIAKILLSKGEGLVKGIRDVKTFKANRTGFNQAKAVIAAKAGQQPYTNVMGN